MLIVINEGLQASKNRGFTARQRLSNVKLGFILVYQSHNCCGLSEIKFEAINKQFMWQKHILFHVAAKLIDEKLLRAKKLLRLKKQALNILKYGFMAR